MKTNSSLSLSLSLYVSLSFTCQFPVHYYNTKILFTTTKSKQDQTKQTKWCLFISLSMDPLYSVSELWTVLHLHTHPLKIHTQFTISQHTYSFSQLCGLTVIMCKHFKTTERNKSCGIMWHAQNPHYSFLFLSLSCSLPFFIFWNASK